MKYVALLSGGKDSCYNLLHCHQNGHVLVAAASLGPEPGKEELDSYMYQTVGQDAIELVARALDVPLHRRVIRGTAIAQGSEYGSRLPGSGVSVSGDETEDLYELLRDVKERYPDVGGVSVGAILSNYQRVRVEQVLGLTPLAYLWQRDQEELLQEMIDAGLKAVLIKVAGIGLEARHLGKTLIEMQHTLLKLNAMYGSHVCGEGGEYETLTLDCPLFKQAIVLDEVETVIHSENSFASVAYLRVKKGSLSSKDTPRDWIAHMPPLLDETSNALAEHMTAPMPSEGSSTTTTSTPSVSEPSVQLDQSEIVNWSGNWLSICNLTAPPPKDNAPWSISDEAHACFNHLKERLDEQGISWSHIASINLFVRDMNYFSSINEVYKTYFGTSPPSRATVSAMLTGPRRMILEILAFFDKTNDARQSLHVQSLSYWAPPNIGPYSQAITVGGQTFISGQIGLIPSSNSLPVPSSLSTEMALSWQHVRRIEAAVNPEATQKKILQSCISWVARLQDLQTIIDAWEFIEEVRTVPLLFLVVGALPKGALVETQTLFHSGVTEVEDAEGFMEAQIVIQKFHTRTSFITLLSFSTNGIPRVIQFL
ncbi:hypothetical protein SISSUDRAFT_979208 [Sistotremastrum suecicum HHB10207 ss-3]|uniref:Diphthine--ammonia ligase n=1 Tax=Sistotremastrum suecicum HHB10207 ss-3 TaxID=1314776 RepID=A0A166HMP2_9AGAM|nr:hypothetical protein SISSUDRAFT_979208 [Sistotremastrum suecicum HHB10207 ss-3]